MQADVSNVAKEDTTVHTSCHGHHGLGVVGAVDVEASDNAWHGDDGVGLVLLAVGTILGGHEACGAGAGLLASRLGQAEVLAAPVVGATGIGGAS